MDGDELGERGAGGVLSPARRGEALVMLDMAASVCTEIQRKMPGLVRQARDEGASWADIARALGMTRQSAWERFKDA